MIRKKLALRWGAFAIALVVFYASVAYILIPDRNDGIWTMRNFYKQPAGTVDILFLGSSHVGMNISQKILWEDYGYSGYFLWGSVQPFWNTYHFLLEALKYQSPQLIVLETYAATLEFEYSDDARQVTNTAGLRLSRNRLDNIRASVPPEKVLNHILILPAVHSTYSYFSLENVKCLFDNTGRESFKGCFEVRNGCEAGQGLKDVSKITKRMPLLGKENEYLMKIIDICEEKQIPLLLISTPTNNRESSQPYFNSVESIAQEEGIPYLNYDLLDSETGFCYEKDFDGTSHLSMEGIKKVTEHLASYISTRYELKDHRGDRTYLSWDTYVDEVDRELMELQR